MGIYEPSSDLITYRADPLDGEDVAEDGVPHDGVAELERLLLLLIEHDQAVHLEADGVGAGQLGELPPPPTDHQLHEESQQKGEISGQRVNITLEKWHKLLEFMLLLFWQRGSIHNVEGVVEDEVGQ